MSDEFNDDDVNEATYSYKAARAGKDIGKPGKNFEKIAKSAGEKYGSAERGKKVAGAILAKIRAKHGMKEEVEELDELSKGTLTSYIDKAATDVHNKAYRAGKKEGSGAGYDVKNLTKGIMRQVGIVKAAKKLAKEDVELDEDIGSQINDLMRQKNAAKSPIARKNIEAQIMKLKKQRSKMSEDVDMTNTDMGGADQIAQSKTGETYKNSTKKTTGPSPATGTSTHVVAAKTGEAYNSTKQTQRMPAVESAVRAVMERTFELKRIYRESADIAIISPDQRQDWINVEMGKMNVVDYFNKYRVTGDE
jgi:hypothetical protein